MIIIYFLADRDTGAPRYNAAMVLYSLQALTFPQLRKVPKVPWIRRICNVSVIIKIPVTFLILDVVPRTKWLNKMIDIVECLIVSCGKFFDDTLDVVPVEHADWWEVQ